MRAPFLTSFTSFLLVVAILSAADKQGLLRNRRRNNVRGGRGATDEEVVSKKINEKRSRLHQLSSINTLIDLKQKFKRNGQVVTGQREDVYDVRRFIKAGDYHDYNEDDATSSNEDMIFYGNYYNTNMTYYDFAGQKLFQDYEAEFFESFNEKYVPNGYHLSEGAIVIIIAIPIMIGTFLVAYCFRRRKKVDPMEYGANYIDSYVSYDYY